MKLRVSDHAVLRYLQRVGGFDIEGIRQQMAARLGPSVTAGMTRVRVDGFDYQIATDEMGPIVTTILDPRTSVYKRIPR